MSEETAVVAEQPSPTLGEAYGDQSLDGGNQPKKREQDLPQRNTQEEEDTSRSRANSSPESTRVPKKEQSLSDAYAGIAPEDEEVIEQDDLPSELQKFSPDAISALMTKFGLSAEDLKDVRWTNALIDALENLEEEGADEPAEQGEEEQDEENKDAKKLEEEQTPPAPVHTELSPDDVKKYVESTWEKSQQINNPTMTKLFEDSLATALETAPEHRELLHNVCELLNYGGVSLIQSALPAMMRENLEAMNHEYMRQHMVPILEHFLPGIQERHNRQTVEDVWSATLEQPEFAKKNLPAYGTAEFDKAAEDVHKKNPWLLNFDPPGPDGKPLPIMDALRARAAITARLLVGDRVDPAKIAQQVSDALNTGKKSASRSTRRVSASGRLGAGRTAGTIGKEAADRESLMEAFQRGGGGGAI
jgi:chemotaxis protein histidine kinase CheA